ncbi:hypothetical protein AAHC03_0262 [Spirometra sp. Aus1]
MNAAIGFKQGKCLFPLILLCASLISGSPKDYRGSKIYELTIPHSVTSDLIEELQSDEKQVFFDILKFPRNAGEKMTLMVHSTGSAEFSRLLDRYSVKAEVIDDDVERSILREKVTNLRAKRSHRGKRFDGRLPINSYLTFNEMEGYIRSFAETSELATFEEFGRSYENRTMALLKLSSNTSLPIIWIDAGIHAREWIAPATALYLIDKLLSPDGKKLLDSFQFYIAPNINPDGYEFSFRNSRYWRKNRMPSANLGCVGVDLNRNFPYKWGERGASTWPCSETYMGDKGGDQPETKAVIKKLQEIKGQVKLYITLHSYGQYMLTPFGYQRSQYPPKYDELIEMAKNVIRSIWHTHGNVYTVGSAADLLYAAAGGSDDFACGELQIPFSYTIELPDSGTYNFLLPPPYIPAVGEQMWTALKVLTEELKTR